MLLHITHDDKFIDGFIDIAKKCSSEEQKLVIYTTDPELKLKHVKSQDVHRVHLYTNAFWKTIGNISQYRVVYIHYLSFELLDFLNSIPKSVKVVWLFWGADAFDLPGLKEETYLDCTKSVVSENTLSIWDKAKRYYSDRKLFNSFRRAVAKVDYFAHYIPEDYDKVKSFLEARFEYIDFTYGTVKQFIIPDKPQAITHYPEKNNIIIGNSANPANNHLDAIHLLNEIDLPDLKIYMPLSYSGTPGYITEVTKEGYKSFGEKFCPLVDFMPIFEYNAVLYTIGYAIMPHKRSQAWGNIIALLWQGVKIYMAEESSLYRLLKNHGFHVFPLGAVKETCFLLPLTQEQTKQNQNLLKQYFGEDATLGRYKNLLSI